MTKRLTAEQVADVLVVQARWHAQFRASADANAFREAANLVREHLIESEDQRRERFERWLGATLDIQLPGGLAFVLGKRGDDYALSWVQERWMSWQAALTYRDSEES